MYTREDGTRKINGECEEESERAETAHSAELALVGRSGNTRGRARRLKSREQKEREGEGKNE